MVGLQLYKGILAASCTGLWLGLHLQHETRWQFGRRLLAGGSFCEIGGEEKVLLLADRDISQPLFKRSTLLPEHACGTSLETGSGGN